MAIQLNLENVSPSCKIKVINAIKEVLADHIHTVSTDLFFQSKNNKTYDEMQKWLDAAKKEHANMLRIISTYS
jgi:hypothetical protein